MRFIASASAILAMVSTAIAQTADFDPIYTPGNLEEVPAGSPFEVTWTAPAKYAGVTISIHLIGGADQNTLVPIADIATGVANSDESYSWTVDAALGAEALYGLVFKLESDPSVFQYSMPFHIKAGNGEDGGDGSVIITTLIGTKTVTLSSCPPTTTTDDNTATVTPTPGFTTTSVELNTTSVYVPTTSLWTTTKAWNTTVIETPTLPPTVPTTSAVELPPTVPTTSAVELPSAVPTAGAARFGSASLAVVGGIAIALLI